MNSFYWKLLGNSYIKVDKYYKILALDFILFFGISKFRNFWKKKDPKNFKNKANIKLNNKGIKKASVVFIYINL